MCYSDEARPPIPPRSGAVAGHGDSRLTAADGNRLLSYYARPERPNGAGVVILPDVRGLHHFYKELAQRFAETGADAVAIDYFGRTTGDERRDEGFVFRSHVDQLTNAGIDADVRAGVAYLRSPEGGGIERVFTIGFCLGGSHSWRQSAAGLGLSGCIGFYGIPALVRDDIPRMRSPLLLLIAGNDFTPQAEFSRFQRELEASHVPFLAKTYAGAPHGFFDRASVQHSEACADAWEQILRFIAER